MKRILMLLLVFTLTVPYFSPVFAMQNYESDKVTLIVKIKGDSLLELQQVVRAGAKDYLSSYEAKRADKSIMNTQMRVMSSIQKNVDSESEVGFTYKYAFNGFSMEANEGDIEKIKSIPDVEDVFISQKYELFDVNTAPIQGRVINNSSQMMNVGYMYEKGYAGEGMVVAIIDNGFDVNHNIFKGSIHNSKLSKNDIENVIDSLNVRTNINEIYKSDKIPFAYNYNANNGNTLNYQNPHGTHVAGIVAGNNGVDRQGNIYVSVAPEAQLVLMACPLLDTASIMASIDDAIKLEADVINLSLGSTYNETHDPLIDSINNAVKAGVFFSSAAGNDSRGYENMPIDPKNIDYGSIGTPSGSSISTAVASVSNTVPISNMTVGSDNNVSFYDANPKALFITAFSNDTEYVYVGQGNADAFSQNNMSGKIALVDRGSSFADIISNVKNSGAVGVILINNEDRMDLIIPQTTLQDIPFAIIANRDANTVRNAASKTIKVNPNINRKQAVSPFTSWGVWSSLELKPEISAPGGGIYSSVNNNAYGIYDGTSMAVPHISGAAALVKQYIKSNPDKYGDVSGFQLIELIGNIIMTSARVCFQADGIPYSPRQQGAGLLDLKKAAETPVILLGSLYGTDDCSVNKTKISLGEIDGNSFNLDFTAKNLTSSSVTYDTIDVMVVTDNVDSKGNIANMKKLGFTIDSYSPVTIDAKSESKVSLGITLNQDELDKNTQVFENGFYIDGYVFLSSSNSNTPKINIPFTGFYGDWSKAPALDKPNFHNDTVLGLTYLYSFSNLEVDGSHSGEDDLTELGENQFTDKKSSEYYSENYVAISPRSANGYRKLHAVVTPLRTLGKLSYSIYDNNGNTIFKADDINPITNKPYYANKFSNSILEIPDNVLRKLNEGNYTFKVESGFIGQKEYSMNETLEMKFYVDNTKPVINSFQTREDNDKLYLDINASDNGHLMGFVLKGKKNNAEFTEVYPIEALKNINHSFDITCVDLSSIIVEAYDYALNCQSRSFEIYDVSYQTDNNNFIFTINNTTGKSFAAELILALYFDGRLVGLDRRDQDVKTDNGIYGFNIQNNPYYDKIKLYIWDSMRSAVPLCKSFEFE